MSLILDPTHTSSAILFKTLDSKVMENGGWFFDDFPEFKWGEFLCFLLETPRKKSGFLGLVHPTHFDPYKMMTVVENINHPFVGQSVGIPKRSPTTHHYREEVGILTPGLETFRIVRNGFEQTKN